MKKWGLILKASAITAILVVVRLVIDLSNYDVLGLTNLITAFIGGAIFTVAIIFTGTLTDYKESEKIPNEIVTSLITLYEDSKLIRPADSPVAVHIRDHIRALANVVIENFRNNRYSNDQVREAVREINKDIYALADQNSPPQFLVKLRSELVLIDKLTSRVKVIAQTSFIPAAYAIAEIAVSGVVLILFFVKLDPYYEGIIIFSIINVLLISILLLIKDMDNPFEYGKKTFADVDCGPLFEMENHLKD